MEEQGCPTLTRTNSWVLGGMQEHPVVGMQKMFLVSLYLMASIGRAGCLSVHPSPIELANSSR